MAPVWLPALWTPRLYPSSDGGRVVDFGESFLHIQKGMRAGERFVATDWQRWLLTNLFERRPDGLLRYRRSLVMLPRKNGKSLLGSLVGLFSLIEGEPGAEVYACAGDKDQARIVFNEAKWQVENSVELSQVCRVNRDVIICPSNDGVFRVTSSDAKLKQGLDPSAVIFDELHVQSNRELWVAMTMGSGARRDPLIVGITTPGFDLGSLCGELYLAGKRIAAAGSRTGVAAEERFGFWSWEAPAGCAIDDRDAWAAANPNLAEGLLDVEDMELACALSDEISFRRYRLGQWVRSDGESWLPKGVWEQCQSELELDLAVPVFVGVDMALRRDSIAVVWCQVQDGGRVVCRSKIWFPDGNIYDVAGVEAFLRGLCEEFVVSEICYDPAYFQRSAEALADASLPMVEFPQSMARMVPACGNLYELIVSGRLAHDGDPVFTDQVLSAAQRQTERGWRLSKGKSKRKIDASIALAMATDRATLTLEAPLVPQIFVD